MASARSSCFIDPAIPFADVRAAEKAAHLERNSLAARTTAVHAQDAAECAQLLAMLGLDLSELK